MKKLRQSGIALIISLIILSVLSSCSTLGKEDKVYSSKTVIDNIRTAEQIEKEIIAQYKEKNAVKIAKIKKDLDKLIKQESSDFDFLATVNALYADYFLLTQNRLNAKKRLDTAKTYSENELVIAVSARLIKTTEERISFLKNHIEKNTNYYRLKAELGNAYYEAEDYTNALVAFDAALDFLPEEYTKLYSGKREFCKNFYKVDSDINRSSAEILKKDKILLYEMTALTQDNTTALDFITGTEKWKPLMLAEKLKANGWYADAGDLKREHADRQSVALFLWHLIAGNNTEKLSKYSRRYEARGGKSPIKDVELDGVYFDAILGTVEEDIIPLIDGLEFKPTHPVSGLEFYNWLKKADSVRKY